MRESSGRVAAGLQIPFASPDHGITASPRFFLGCPFCVRLECRSVLCRDPNESLRERHLVSIPSLWLGDQESCCFPLARISDSKKRKPYPMPC